MSGSRISDKPELIAVDILHDYLIIVDASEPDITRRTKKILPVNLLSASANVVITSNSSNSPVGALGQEVFFEYSNTTILTEDYTISIGKMLYLLGLCK